MTRDQMKALLPDGTDDAVVTALLDAMHAEITPYKDAAKKAEGELAAKVGEMAEVSKNAATAQEKAEAYDALQAKYEKDVAEANARAETLAFDGLIDGALRDGGARNLKAARALLDLDALRASKNRDADVKAAIDGMKAAEDTAFLFGAAPTGERVTIGADMGRTPPAMSGVEAKFMARNPNIKID